MFTEIGRRIAAARETSGLSIEAVAEYLGVDAADVSGIEAGTRRIDLDTLDRLADLFGLSPEYFLSGRDDPDHPPSSPQSFASGSGKARPGFSNASRVLVHSFADAGRRRETPGFEEAAALIRVRLLDARASVRI
ncbi:helix-turn-helix domain-containing protein [Hydrogenibacillus schlegelii]|uniref:helix-turn-helix domain-containing protein n=1 Tax=Hydrogenibacillus schlegelii TaxID=1484 RepID=UPI002357F78C|nr:helix-turn-helix transcriptional regulator [Hydrogenibacillus schlegelii]